MRRALPIVLVWCLAGCIDFDADRKLCRMQGRCGDAAAGGAGGGSSTGVGGGNTGGGGGAAGGGLGGGSAGGGGGSAAGGGSGGGLGGGTGADGGTDGGTDAGTDGGSDGGCAPGFHNTCGVGACKRTINMCVPDSDLTTCMPGAPVMESCNLMDDDCNGSTDEGDRSCGVGVCARTVPACVGGAINTCVPGNPMGPDGGGGELCNGLDDDCSGVAEQGQWLKDLFAVNSRLDVALNCQQMSFPVIGTTYIADQGNSAGSGRLSASCSVLDAPAAITVTVNASTLTFPDAGTASLALTMRIATVLPIYTSSNYTAACLGLGDAQCSYRFDSITSAPATNTAVATIAGSSDGGFPRLVSLKMQTLQGMQICGATGAGAPPQCFSPTDFQVMGENFCGSSFCGLPEFDALRTYLLQTIGGLLQTKIRDVIEKQVCEPCGTGLKACPP